MKNSRAISTVLTTIIILTSSLILASGVVLFGTGLFQKSSLTEATTIYEVKLWVEKNSDEGLVWGALKIRNTGDTVASVDTIKIRGTEIPFSNWYADNTVSDLLLQKSLIHPGWSGTNGMISESDPDGLCSETIQVDLDGTGGEEPVCANASSSPVSMNPTDSSIIYFKMPNGTIYPIDAGLTSGVLVVSGKSVFTTSIVIEST